MSFPTPIGPARLLALKSIDYDDGARVILDSDNLERLRHLIEAGVELDPIKVMQQPNGRFLLLGGNHRRQLAQDRGDTEIRAVIYPKMTPLEIVYFVIADNNGLTGKNPTPLTEADLRYNIRKLLEKKQTPAAIAAALPLPVSYAKQLINAVQAQVLKMNKAAALEHLGAHPNQTVAVVAPQFGLKPEQLSDTIGRKGKRLKNFDSANPAKNDNAKLGARIRGLSREFNATMRTAILAYQDGKRDQKSVITVLNHVDGLLKEVQGYVNNARVRVTNLA